MNNIKFSNRITSLVLLLSVLLSLFGVLASASRSAEDTNVDFSRDGSLYDVTVPPSEVLRALFPDTVSDAEAHYADKYFENALVYSSDVSAENVTVCVDGDTVSVSARAHSFTAHNGRTVTWTPVSAVMGAQSAQMQAEGGNYVCSFTLTADTSVTVSFKATLSLPKAYVEGLSSLAYSDAKKAAEIKSAHRTALEEYLAAYERYQAYLDDMDEYYADMERYGEYLEQKKIYEECLAEYNTYLSLLSKYESDLAAYEKYLGDYKAYLAEKKKYDDAYNANVALYEDYKAYLANLARIRGAMTAMESIYVTPSNGVGPLFGALQNSEIISMIEENQEALVRIYGIKQSDVTEMRAASDALTEMLCEYNDARAESEQAAFEYYKANYADISENFNYLYEKMTAILVGNPNVFIHVCTLFENKYDQEMAKYKKWRIRNVLCHIYLICHALDDESTLGTKWQFYQDNGSLFSYDFSDLLAQNVIISDTNAASPASLEWINGDRFGTALLTPPTMPSEVKQPTPPREVAEPTEPTEVAKPTAPDAVTEPAAPKLEDFALVLRTEQYLDGVTLAPRAVPDSPTLTLSHAVTRPFTTDGAPLCAYFNYDGTLLSVDTEPDSPTRADTPSHTYTFREWQERASGADTLFYALYDSEKRVYDISFRYSEDGDDVYTCQCEYGELPIFEGEIPTKTPTNTAVYTFAGWYPQLLPVTDDTVFVAQFTESERLYNISWDILGTTQSRALPYGAQLTPPSVTQKRYVGGSLYEFTGWDSAPSAVTADKTYTALFNVTPLCLGEGEVSIYHNGTSYVLTAGGMTADVSGLLTKAQADGSGLVINMGGMTLRLDSAAVSSFNTNGAKKFNVLTNGSAFGYSFTNSDGNSVRLSGEARMSLPNTLGKTENLYVVYTAPNNTSGETVCSATADFVEFNARPDNIYEPRCYYSVAFTTAEGGSVSTTGGGTLFRVGGTVMLDIKPSPENTLSSLTVTDADGNVTDILSDRYFTMPRSDVTVTAVFTQRTYTVTFISNGAVISTAEYLLGDKIVIPEIPLSFEKDGYTYTFVGWSEPLSESSVVTGNAVYTAKYTSILTELKPTPDTQTATDKVIKDQLIPLVAFVLLFAGTVTLLVIFTVKLVKRQKSINGKK